MLGVFPLRANQCDFKALPHCLICGKHAIIEETIEIIRQLELCY